MSGPRRHAEGVASTWNDRLGRTLGPLCAAVLAAAALAMPSLARPAAASLTGGIAFQGTVALPFFPCAGTCAGGTFNGTATGVAVGSGGAVVAAFAAAPMHADFSYTEACQTSAGPVPPLAGSATGTFSIGPQNGSTLTGSFDWQRVGVTVVITTSNVTLTTPAGSSAATGPSAATAVFVPEPAVGSCAVGGTVTNQLAQVVGADVGAE